MKAQIIPLIICVACMLSSCAVAASSKIPTSSDIILDIQKVKSEQDINSRMLLVGHMSDDFYAVRTHGAMDSIDDRVIDELIALLNDDEDGVRLAAAAAIGEFGTRARRATPALERALERLKEENEKSSSAFQSGVSSGVTIIPALKRIQGIPDGEIFDDPSVPHY